MIHAAKENGGCNLIRAAKVRFMTVAVAMDTTPHCEQHLHVQRAQAVAVPYLHALLSLAQGVLLDEVLLKSSEKSQRRLLGVLCDDFVGERTLAVLLGACHY